LKQVLQEGQVVSVKEGQIIYKEGDQCNRFYFILKGSVGLYSKEKGGVIETIKVEGCVGEEGIFDKKHFCFLETAFAS